MATGDSKRRELRIVFFGDSICVGQGVSIYKGWVTRIAREMEELGRELGRELLVVNASINGNTTRMALERMPYDVQSHGVDLMITQFGLNDCNHWVTDQGVPRVSRDAFIANMREIMTRGRIFGARRILLNNNHPTTREHAKLPSTEITYEDSNRAYNAALRELGQTAGPDVDFTDIEQAFLKRLARPSELSAYLLTDELHLSAAGHDVYFEIMAPKVRKAVQEIVAAGH